MTRIYLVRHGQAAAGWDVDADPGLDDLGRDQADAAAARLAPLGPLPIVCSPLRRTLETAAPLAARWGVAVTVDERVAEIPSPTDDLSERGAWLRAALAGTWSELAPELLAWRDRLFGALTTLQEDTVAVTHFVAINAVIGASVGDDRMVVQGVGNASITVLEREGDGFRLVTAPADATTEVL